MTTANLPAGLGFKDFNRATSSLAARLPEPLRPMATIAYNMGWSWHPNGESLFEAIDPELWHFTRHNPVRLLVEATPQVLGASAADPALVDRVEAVAADLQADLERPFNSDLDPERPVAFLCAEFGMHESLPQYSGGLGVLAGDIVKEASDLALPMIAVGLFYRLGYFQQRLDATGWQHESWVPYDPATGPLVRVTDSNGQQLLVRVPVRGRDIIAKVWQVQVGRVPLFLLDTDLPVNEPAERWTTARLYDADPDIRLAQYTVLGVGAIRVLRALGVEPGIVHLNEGHAAQAALELAAEEVERGATFHDARESVRRRCVFTTHTPVQAGNETYPPETLLSAVPTLAERLGLQDEELLNLGRVHPDGHEQAGMTPVAMRLSRSTNGVSQRHGEVARAMWNELFPGPVEEVPITHVTNGVHLPTWMGPHFRGLLDQHLGDGWWHRAEDPTTWKAVQDIPDEQIWGARQLARRDLIAWMRERSAVDRLRRGEGLSYVQAAMDSLHPDVLTVGFARRVAAYKRLHLLTRDVDRMIALLTGDQRLQLLIAGKAHPKDDGAKGIVRDLFAYRGSRAIAERVVFVEDYDIEVGRRLTSGCDVWLNVPRPPLEASGTSGMKVVLNGGLNLSVLDGWWAEGFDGTNGWGIDGSIDPDHGHQDHAHNQALVELLTKEVLPTFYDRGKDGVPARWVQMVKSSLMTLGPQFCATRMMRDYQTRIYPAPE